MDNITTVGLDLAKQVFRVHGIDASGAVVLRRSLRRGQVMAFFAALPRCRVGMEACAGAHHWTRTLEGLGHEVRIMPAQYVRPYVKRNKTDAADAEAICEALTRPSMRFVPIKTSDQQAALARHRVRDLLVRQRTALANALRGLLAEFGLVGARGLGRIDALLADAADPHKLTLPVAARPALAALAAQLATVARQIKALDKEIVSQLRSDPVGRRLATIPGIGPITAAALSASVPDPAAFEGARQFAAWLGLVPRQHSTGGISKRGDAYLRRLLVNGAQSVLRGSRSAKADPWLTGLSRRRPRLVVAVALANKMARIAWALMRSGQIYKPRVLAPAA
jgi:transposase